MDVIESAEDLSVPNSAFGAETRASCVWKELRLVMEFLGGGSMDDVLGMRRFLPETQAGLLTWCVDVLCQAVSTVNMSGFGRLPANC